MVKKGEPIPWETWPFGGAYISDRAMQGAYENAIQEQLKKEREKLKEKYDQ